MSHEAAFAQPYRSFFDCLDGSNPDQSPVVQKYLLVKLVTRCNLACTYCYWFRDDHVYTLPKRMTQEVETAFLERLAEHITRHGISEYFILFHGGEPTLFGCQRFERLCAALRALETDLGFSLRLAITTNGLLIDAAWAALLAQWRVGVTLSIDGPEDLNDQRRVGFAGEGSFSGTIRGLSHLRKAGVEPGFLGVCDPKADPEALMAFFVEDLGARSFDVLIPDATHEDTPASIATFYKGLFDCWYDRYLDRGIRVRLLESMVHLLLGEPSNIESIGYGPITTSTLLTDGAIEPLDVLRMAGNRFTRTNINIFEHGLQDIQSDPLWREILKGSLDLPETCRACRYHQTCGGGHMGQRWSESKRFDNPNVYCADIKEILDHVRGRLFADIQLELPASARQWLESCGVCVS